MVYLNKTLRGYSILDNTLISNSTLENSLQLLYDNRIDIGSSTNRLRTLYTYDLDTLNLDAQNITTTSLITTNETTNNLFINDNVYFNSLNDNKSLYFDGGNNGYRLGLIKVLGYNPFIAVSNNNSFSVKVGSTNDLNNPSNTYGNLLDITPNGLMFINSISTGSLNYTNYTAPIFITNGNYGINLPPAKIDYLGNEINHLYINPAGQLDFQIVELVKAGAGIKTYNYEEYLALIGETVGLDIPDVIYITTNQDNFSIITDALGRLKVGNILQNGIYFGNNDSVSASELFTFSLTSETLTAPKMEITTNILYDDLPARVVNKQYVDNWATYTQPLELVSGTSAREIKFNYNSTHFTITSNQLTSKLSTVSGSPIELNPDYQLDILYDNSTIKKNADNQLISGLVSAPESVLVINGNELDVKIDGLSITKTTDFKLKSGLIFDAPLSLNSADAHVSIGVDNSTIKISGSQLTGGYIAGSNITLSGNEISVSTSLSSQVDTNKTNIQNLQSTVNTLQSDLSSLQSTVSTLSSTVSTLQSEITGALSSIGVLQGEVAVIQGQISTIQATLATQTADIATLQGQIATLQNEINIALGLGAVDFGVSVGTFMGTLFGATHSTTDTNGNTIITTTTGNFAKVINKIGNLDDYGQISTGSLYSNLISTGNIYTNKLNILDNSLTTPSLLLSKTNTSGNNSIVFQSLNNTSDNVSLTYVDNILTYDTAGSLNYFNNVSGGSLMLLSNKSNNTFGNYSISLQSDNVVLDTPFTYVKNKLSVNTDFSYYDLTVNGDIGCENIYFNKNGYFGIHDDAIIAVDAFNFNRYRLGFVKKSGSTPCLAFSNDSFLDFRLASSNDINITSNTYSTLLRLDASSNLTLYNGQFITNAISTSNLINNNITNSNLISQNITTTNLYTTSISCLDNTLQNIVNTNITSSNIISNTGVINYLNNSSFSSGSAKISTLNSSNIISNSFTSGTSFISSGTFLNNISDYSTIGNLLVNTLLNCDNSVLTNISNNNLHTTTINTSDIFSTNINTNNSSISNLYNISLNSSYGNFINSSVGSLYVSTINGSSYPPDITSFTNSNLNTSNATITNLVSTNSSISNLYNISLNSSYANFVNSTINSLQVSTINNASYPPDLTSITNTNINTFNATITNLLNTNSTINSLQVSNIISQNNTFTNLLLTNASISNLYYTSSTQSNSLNSTITNLVSTNSTISNIYNTNINSFSIGNYDGSSLKVGYGGVKAGYISSFNADNTINTYSSAVNTLSRDGLFIQNGGIEITQNNMIITSNNGSIIDMTSRYGSFGSIECYTAGNTLKLPLYLNGYGGDVNIGGIIGSSNLNISGGLSVGGSSTIPNIFSSNITSSNLNVNTGFINNLTIGNYIRCNNSSGTSTINTLQSVNFSGVNNILTNSTATNMSITNSTANNIYVSNITSNSLISTNISTNSLSLSGSELINADNVCYGIDNNSNQYRLGWVKKSGSTPALAFSNNSGFDIRVANSNDISNVSGNSYNTLLTLTSLGNLYLTSGYLYPQITYTRVELVSSFHNQYVIPVNNSGNGTNVSKQLGDSFYYSGSVGWKVPRTGIYTLSYGGVMSSVSSAWAKLIIGVSGGNILAVSQIHNGDSDFNVNYTGAFNAGDIFYFVGSSNDNTAFNITAGSTATLIQPF